MTRIPFKSLNLLGCNVYLYCLLGLFILSHILSYINPTKLAIMALKVTLSYSCYIAKNLASSPTICTSNLCFREYITYDCYTNLITVDRNLTWKLRTGALGLSGPITSTFVVSPIRPNSTPIHNLVDSKVDNGRNSESNCRLL